jgi:hypothetical protein
MGTNPMRHTTGLLAAVMATAAIGLSACGGSSIDAVARVAGVAITRSAVRHLAAVLLREHVPPASGYGSLRTYALALLLVSTWVIEEARARGVGVSQQEAQQGVKRKAQMFPAGEAEFDQLMRLSGRTAADATFAERAQLSAARIIGQLTRNEPTITEAQITSYYRAHEASFATDEQRKVAVAHSESKIVVERIKREMRGLTTGQITTPLTELLEYAQGGHPSNEDALYTAIYAAKPRVPGGPIKAASSYFVFDLTEIIPSRQESLAAVGPRISGRLREQQHRATIAAFFAAFRRRWVQRTGCDSGWLVEQCRLYRGAREASQIDPFTQN